MSGARQQRLVLASASPRRRQLLDSLGIRFEVRPVDIDESPQEGEPAAELVRRLAREKAEAAGDGVSGSDAGRGGPRSGEVVLAADTVVVLDDRILGKPADAGEATEMLSQLAGREHTVLSGVALRDTGTTALRVKLARTRVHMGPLDAERIAWYVATGEPMDKAGAYAIQGLGAVLVESIRGNYTNVVGLPLPTVRALLSDLGYELFDFR